MASGSFKHLWKKVAAPPSYSVLKMVAAPFSARSEAAPPIKAEDSAEKAKVQKGKRTVFRKLKCLTVETIDLIIKDEERKGVSVTQEDLVKWAKRLRNEDNKPENALEIFRWMDRKKMKFSPTELALYVDLIARVKNVIAASDYFDKVDPDFDDQDPNAENWPAYWRLAYWFEVNRKNSLAGLSSLTHEEEARSKKFMSYNEAYYYKKYKN